jgi:hypothetical protein
VKLGLSAHISGDGFVVSQSPEAGATIDGDGVRLVLDRLPPHRVATAGRP